VETGADGGIGKPGWVTGEAEIGVSGVGDGSATGLDGEGSTTGFGAGGSAESDVWMDW